MLLLMSSCDAPGIRTDAFHDLSDSLATGREHLANHRLPLSLTSEPFLGASDWKGSLCGAEASEVTCGLCVVSHTITQPDIATIT